MTAVAQRSGGAFHFVADASKVAQVLEDEMLKMERVVARGVWLDVTPGPGVVIDEVLGAVPMATGRGMRLTVGEIGEGQGRDVVVRVTTTSHHDGSPIELLDAVAHYSHAVAGGELEVRQFLALAASLDAGRVTAARNADVEQRARCSTCPRSSRPRPRRRGRSRRRWPRSRRLPPPLLARTEG